MTYKSIADIIQSGGENTVITKELINITEILSVKKYVTKEKDIGKIYRYDSTIYRNELIFYFTGETDVEFGGKKMKHLANSLRFLPKGRSCGDYKVEIKKPSFCIDIYFDCNEKLAEEAFIINDAEILKNDFLKIYNLWNEQKNCWYEKSMIVLYEIICTIKNLEKQYVTNDKRVKIENAYTYIIKNYRNPDFDYTALAKESGYCYSYFSELFEEIYDQSPIKMVTDLRLKYAKELLITNRYSINEIAVLSGFNSISYFSKVFKKNFGVSPKKYNLKN